MTVASSSLSLPPEPDAMAGADSPELTWLSGDLQRRVAQAARTSGMSVAAVCEQWVREGLDRFEAHPSREDAEGSGRCSLRTGSCSQGPVPLPVQQ